MPADPTPQEPERSEKFVAAEQSLPEELRPTFARLVDEYQYQAHVLGGFPWVAYRIIAELVRAGWQPTRERDMPSVEMVREGSRHAGLLEGLRCAMLLVRANCLACKGSGKEQEPDGSATECQYCGRPLAAIRAELTS